MIFIKAEDNFSLLSHRYLWRKHHLYLRCMVSDFWFRDKIFSTGVKCIGKNEHLDELFVCHLSELMLDDTLEKYCN